MCDALAKCVAHTCTLESVPHFVMDYQGDSNIQGYTLEQGRQEP